MSLLGSIELVCDLSISASIGKILNYPRDECPIDVWAQNVRIKTTSGLLSWMMRSVDVQGASFPIRSVLRAGMLFLATDLILLVLYAFWQSPLLLTPMLEWMIFGIIIFVLVFILHHLGVILIRKECYECQLGFHIIEHEKTHLKLNSLDEKLVETETLKLTASKLFPIILSKPKLCKRCGFRGKRYLVAATENIPGQKEGTSTG